MVPAPFPTNAAAPTPARPELQPPVTGTSTTPATIIAARPPIAATLWMSTPATIAARPSPIAATLSMTLPVIPPELAPLASSVSFANRSKSAAKLSSEEMAASL